MTQNKSIPSGNKRRSSSDVPGKAIHSKVKPAVPVIVTSFLLVVLLISACSLSASIQTGTPTPVPPTNIASPTSTSMQSGNSQSPTSQTSLDPCVLISSQEASALAGAPFGPGKEETTSGGGKICVYGSNTNNVMTIDVAQTADKAAAEVAKQDFLTMLQTNLAQLTNEGFQITELPAFADGGITSQVTINTGSTPIYGSMFGFVKGTIFFGFSDLVNGGPAPTLAAMQAEATVVLGRLP